MKRLSSVCMAAGICLNLAKGSCQGERADLLTITQILVLIQPLVTPPGPCVETNPRETMCKHLRICSPVTEPVHTSQYQYMNPSRDDDIVYIIQYIENNLRLINCYARSFRLFKADPDTRVGDPIHLTSPHPPVSPSATTAKRLSCYYHLRLRHSRLTI